MGGAMSSRRNARTEPSDPRRFITPASRRAADKTAAIVSLTRAARRCARHLGAGSAAALLALVRAELGRGQ